MSKPSVLVTGGSGLIGSAIKDELTSRGGVDGGDGEMLDGKFHFKFLSSKDGDLTDFQAAERIFFQIKPQFVINLAAHVGGLYANMSNNETFYRLNNKINGNVLELSRTVKVNKCISCLSTCIFPAHVHNYPIDETMVSYSIVEASVCLLSIELTRKISIGAKAITKLPPSPS